jgi:glucose-6-phosphate isomerase
MTTHPAPRTARRAWKALAAHYAQVRELHLRQLFADDPTRGERITAEAGGVYLDYSKHRMTDETLTLLLLTGSKMPRGRRMSNRDCSLRGEKRRAYGNVRRLRTQPPPPS